MTVADVAREIGCSLRTVKRVVATPGQAGGATGSVVAEGAAAVVAGAGGDHPRPARGDSFTTIARQLRRSTSTVSREVNANGGRELYRAWPAHDPAYHQARRPKPAKLACPHLARQVTEWLEQWWSPEEISRRLPIEFPDDPMMRVSHERIYQSIYVQGRGELRRELARCLRTGRSQRRPRNRVQTCGRIPTWS